MPGGRKRKVTDPLTESSKPRRRRRVKAEPGASSSDPASWPSEEQKLPKVKVEPVDIQQDIAHYTCSTLHGYSYPYLYAKDGKCVVLEWSCLHFSSTTDGFWCYSLDIGVMVNKGVKELAERVEEQQVELPSIDLLNGIHMVGANRLFRQHELTRGIFRRSALFALGVLMEEWAKQTAEDLKWTEDVGNGPEEDHQTRDAAEWIWSATNKYCWQVLPPTTDFAASS